jgi:hypothetical protein
MATSTLPNTSPEEKNNPGQDEFDKLIARNFSPGDERMMEERAQAGAAADDADTSEPPTSEELSDAENNPDSPVVHENQVGRGYRRGQRQTSRLSLRGRITRRRAIFGGSITGTIIALVLLLTGVSGPLTFIHIAQLMQRFHFSHQQNASNDRMGRLYRYARTGNPGETRLGWLGSKMHASMLADMEKIGLKPHYSTIGGVFDSFEIDRTSPNSPFKDMSNEEIISALAAKGADVSKIEFLPAEGKGGLPTVRVSVDSYKGRKAGFKFLSDQIGTSDIPGPLRVRVLSRYGLVSWHPMKRIDASINQKLSDLYDKWKSSREQRLDSGVGEGELNTANAQDQETDPKTGKPTSTTPAPGDNGPLPSSKAKDLLNGIKESKSLKIGGALSTGVGLVCTVYEVDKNMGEIRFAQVIAPLTRMGMDAVTVGNQIMTGNDVSSTEVSFLAKSFNEVDSKGNITSTWNQAAPIQAELGQPYNSSKDIDSEASQTDVKDALSGEVPGWISWVNSVPKVGSLCGTTGSLITGAVGFAVGIFSGEIANTIGGAVAGQLAFPTIIDKLSHFLSGESVNVAAAGAQWGSDIDYGSRLAANSMSLLFGGVKLTSAQSSQLQAMEDAQSQADFNSHNIAYKIFDPYDERSAISKVIDGSSTSFTQNIARMGSMFVNFGKSFSSIGNIFNAKASAAQKPYDYGFAEYGFSAADLNNPAVSDPYANADAVAAILDNPSNRTYISRAHDCFGVDIQKVSDPNAPSGQLWDVLPVSSQPPDPYDSSYESSSHCNDPNDPNWLKIRFFIFDTGVMEGYACYKGDDQSCQNDGFGDSSAQTVNTTTTAGDTADLSTAFDDSTSIACAAGTKDLGIQDGYRDGQVVKIRVCAVSNLPSTSEESNNGYGVTGAGGNVVVNSRVSGAVYAMAQAASKDGIPLMASSGFRTMQHQQALFAQNPDPNRVAVPGTSNHQMGLAIDFSGLPSTPGPVAGNPVWDWLVKNAGNFGYKNYPQEAWHWSLTGN